MTALSPRIASIRRLLAERSFWPLAMCTLLCFTFLIVRAYVMQHVGYVFLVKNLFLAWIPYGLSLAALHLHRTPAQQSPRRWLIITSLWLAWLAMLPNAPYI